MQDLNQAEAFINALGGGVFNFRCVHDRDKAVEGVNFRGTISECWQSLVHYNQAGYGIFAVINECDGVGQSYQNVIGIRAQFVDLDNLNAWNNLQRANEWILKPSFSVNSSPNKWHVYWPVMKYSDKELFQNTQQKLIQFFDADRRCFDAPRIMRLPGTYHNKGEPYLVTCSGLAGFGNTYDVADFQANLQHVNVNETFGERLELGDPEKAAPSLEWLQFALDSSDPNTMDRGDWIGFTAAVKQAGWSLTDPDTLFKMWSDWCARYEHNDLGENLKQWNSIKNAQLGWPAIEYRVPAVKAHMRFSGVTQQQPVIPATLEPGAAPVDPTAASEPPPMPEPPKLDCKGELLTAMEQQEWFKGCVFISNMGKIMTPVGRLMNATQFNGEFGGKKFIIDEQAKVINEPWQAALRSTLWTIPKADHIRFLPHRPHLELYTDELGRGGVNSYKPAIIRSQPGDVNLFLQHLALILPDQNDQRILIEYLAHNAKFPGFKIPWSPLIQSAEGVGKGVFKAVLKHVMGSPYIYYPKAKELVESGSKFNAWMRNKLFILVDEIKTDERRDMIEILKDFISEKEIEIQGKGDDQDKEDNYSNWMFFSNWKDAIPVNKNGRRFSINYSALQTEQQILQAGMDDAYFNRLFFWLEHQDGLEMVAHYLLTYPIERGAISMRAPKTSSTKEALRQSQSPIEKVVTDAIADDLPGFKGGYVSTLAVTARIKQVGLRAVSTKTIAIVLEQLGFTFIGRANRPYFAEDATIKADLYHTNPNAVVDFYGQWQGYE